MARLYANENFPFAIVEELRRLGHNVVTIQETGKAGIRTPDDEVLQCAVAGEAAVLTLNRNHFFRLHNLSPDHPGIIACTTDSDFVGQAGRIHAAIEAVAGELAGKLIRVNRFAS